MWHCCSTPWPPPAHALQRPLSTSNIYMNLFSSLARALNCLSLAVKALHYAGSESLSMATPHCAKHQHPVLLPDAKE